MTSKFLFSATTPSAITQEANTGSRAIGLDKMIYRAENRLRAMADPYGYMKTKTDKIRNLKGLADQQFNITLQQYIDLGLSPEEARRKAEKLVSKQLKAYMKVIEDSMPSNPLSGHGVMSRSPAVDFEAPAESDSLAKNPFKDLSSAVKAPAPSS